MLSIILTILKIIGILILVLLGILLTVILLVLLVPIRYYAKGSYYGKLVGTAKVTWLLHILSAKVTYDKEVKIIVRIFGIPVGNRKSSGKAKHKPDDDGMETDLYPEDDGLLTVQEIGKDRESLSETVTKPEQDIKSDKDTTSNQTTTPEQSTATSSKNKTSATSPGFIRRIIDKIKGFFQKLKFSFRRLCDKLKDIRASIDQGKAWLANEKNKALIRLLKRQVMKLFKHILPRKAKGKVKFGFDDPYTTGQVLSYISLIYPFCHKQLEVYPVFGEGIFEGEGYFKGRIRVGTVLVLGVRLLFNKQFRILLKKFLG